MFHRTVYEKKEKKKKEREVLVICLEGCHGVAKTTIFTRLKEKIRANGNIEDTSGASKGFSTFMKGKVVFMEERFLPNEDARMFHGQSLIAETKWMAHWFDRLEDACMHYYDKQKECFTEEAPVIIIADRSPLSSCVYARASFCARAHLNGLTHETMLSFSKKGIQIKTFCMFGDKKLVYKRVQKRLKKEAWRKKFGEGSEEWFETIWDRYETQMKWDVRIPTNEFKEVYTKLLLRVPIIEKFFKTGSKDEDDLVPNLDEEEEEEKILERKEDPVKRISK